MRGAIVLLVLLFGSVTYAGGVETVIDLPVETFQPGHSMVFSVFFYNQETNPLAMDVPNSITCRLKAGDRSVEVEALAVHITSEKTMTICPGCFKKKQYSLVIPSVLDGTVLMEIPHFKAAHAMFAVQTDNSMKTSKDEKTESKEYATLDSIISHGRPDGRFIRIALCCH